MKLYGAMFRVILRRPLLLPPLLGLAWRSRRREWYRRPPFLPLPSRAYLEWRMDTAYGDPDFRPPAHEIARYLRWTGGMRRMNRSRSARFHG